MMGAEAEGPSPEVLAAIGKLTASDRALLVKMWSRSSTKPVWVNGPDLRQQARVLEGSLLLLVDLDDQGREYLVLSAWGNEVVGWLRRMGDKAPPVAHGLKLLSGALDRAEAEAVPPPEGDRDAGRSDGSAAPPRTRKPERQPGEIYPGCPVTALGVSGKFFHYLDTINQLQSVDGHTGDRMSALFGGRVELMMNAWPRWSKGSEDEPPRIIGWKQDDARAAMQRACTEKGVWSAADKVRGRGAWRDPEGGVILHCGDGFLYQGEWRVPGYHEDRVYPAADRIPRPLGERPSPAAASELLDALKSWNWDRGASAAHLDAYLLLGWSVAAKFGGALDWRPTVWITGDAGSGKSTLQKLLTNVMGGDKALLYSTDATEAAVRQFLAQHVQSTVPVLLDEAEPDLDNRRILAVVKLARQASSGAMVLRGGSDHQAQGFVVRSAFMFSSILIPPLLDQDLSRIAVLTLRDLPKGRTPPDPEHRKWARAGRAIMDQVIAQWPRLHRTLELYRQALAAAGHSARGCDQYGTLLAMADLSMSDAEPTPEACAAWAARLQAESVTDRNDQSADWQRCLNHLFGQHLDIFRSGERHSVWQWVRAAAGIADDPDPLKAARALPGWGLRVVGRGPTAVLMVANNHPMLGKLFEGTHWFSPAGQTGVWVQAIKRVPGAESSPTAANFSGVKARAWQFRLSAVPNFGHDDVPQSEPERHPVTGEDFA